MIFLLKNHSLLQRFKISLKVLRMLVSRHHPILNWEVVHLDQVNKFKLLYFCFDFHLLIIGTKTVETPRASGYLSFLNALHPFGMYIILTDTHPFWLFL